MAPHDGGESVGHLVVHGGEQGLGVVMLVALAEAEQISAAPQKNRKEKLRRNKGRTDVLQLAHKELGSNITSK